MGCSVGSILVSCVASSVCRFHCSLLCWLKFEFLVQLLVCVDSGVGCSVGLYLSSLCGSLCVNSAVDCTVVSNFSFLCGF